MNKSELVGKVVEKSGLKKKEAEKSVNAVMECIEEALIANDKVQLVGFGTFETRKQAARTGRNPQTGEQINIPEKKVPAFKAGKQLKDKIN